VDDVPEQNALRFTISDHGIGIDPEMMPQLFKPFSQIDSSLSRNYEGTGLGLALVSRLVAMHGGSTSLNSTGQPGEGSTFTVILPINHQLESPTSLTDWAAQYNDTNPLVSTILLGEDDHTAIQAITSALQPLGCQIDVALTGTKFLQQARSVPPQIFLLNMQITEMEGWQVLSILKEDSALQNIPILCFTSLMITGDPQRYADAGASAFLLKPFQIETLLKWLKSQKP
jgi:CheY-like chemotaxis protein